MSKINLSEDENTLQIGSVTMNLKKPICFSDVTIAI